MTSPSSSKLRVLCLHGFRTNAQVMKDQTRELRALLGENAEFVFLDGTFEAVESSDPLIEQRYEAHKPFFEWWRLPSHTNGDDDIADTDDYSAQRTQRYSDPENTNWYLFFDGVYETIEAIDAKIQALGPFDVVMGFSQGAILLTVLTMWYLKHHLTMRWQLSVCVGGVGVHGQNVRSLFETPEGLEILSPLPSIHVIGREDPLYEEGFKLAARYEDQLVVQHDSGHRFPSLKRNPEAFEAIVGEIQRRFPQFEIARPSARL